MQPKINTWYAPLEDCHKNLVSDTDCYGGDFPFERNFDDYSEWAMSLVNKENVSQPTIKKSSKFGIFVTWFYAILICIAIMPLYVSFITKVHIGTYYSQMEQVIHCINGIFFQLEEIFTPFVLRLTLATASTLAAFVPI